MNSLFTRPQLDDRSDAGRPLRLAYLTNAYPKVSHSFIRREIEALEDEGVVVRRFTIRRSDDALPDPKDRQELERTTVLIGGARRNLAVIVSTMLLAVLRPVRFFKGVGAAMRLGSMQGRVLRHFFYLAEACRLVRLLEGEGIDRLHVHFGTNPGAVARLAALLGRVHYSMTVHGPDEFDDPRGHALAEKVAASAFTAAVSSFGRGQLMRWTKPVHWPKIRVVRCSVAPHFLARTLTPPSRELRLACVARLSGAKGLPILIEALALVRAAHPSVRLQLIGDGELRAVLERRAAELRIADAIDWLGWRSEAEIIELIEGSRVFVLPSFAEGLPVVLMEALALGRPVITTSIAGIPELVDDGCGWLIPSGSVEHLAAALDEALSATPEWLAAMGADGRRRVAAQHDARGNARLLLRHFRADAPC